MVGGDAEISAVADHVAAKGSGTAAFDDPQELALPAGGAGAVGVGEPIYLAGDVTIVDAALRGQIVHDIPQEQLSERTIIEAMVRGAKLGNVEDQFAAFGREE